MARAHSLRALGSGVLQALALDPVGVPSVALPPVPDLGQLAAPLARSRSTRSIVARHGKPFGPTVWYRPKVGRGVAPATLFLLVGWGHLSATARLGNEGKRRQRGRREARLPPWRSSGPGLSTGRRCSGRCSSNGRG